MHYVSAYGIENHDGSPTWPVSEEQFMEILENPNQANQILKNLEPLSEPWKLQNPYDHFIRVSNKDLDLFMVDGLTSSKILTKQFKLREFFPDTRATALYDVLSVNMLMNKLYEQAGIIRSYRKSVDMVYRLKKDHQEVFTEFLNLVEKSYLKVSLNMPILSMLSILNDLGDNEEVIATVSYRKNKILVMMEDPNVNE